MKFIFFFLSFFLLNSINVISQERGDLVSSEWLGNRSVAQITAVYADFGIPTFLSPIDYEIDLIKIVYVTAAATGDSLTVASGLLLVPIGSCDFPLYCYNHGTSFYGSPMSSLNGEWEVGIFHAANGYVSVLPDYLGMGETPIEHPHTYIHAKSEATAVVDILRATRQYCAQNNIALNDQLFLTGYSQGGHVAMSALRELEMLHSDEFTVTAAAPASGPYDVSGTTRDSLLQNKPSETAAYYLSYVITSYQYVYGNMWDEPSEIFVAPYDSLVPAFFDRAGPPVQLTFPDTARTMYHPGLVDSLLEDTLYLHPINQALRDNDLYDWQPQTPTQMHYCEADEQVPFQNALVAQNQFLANGSSSTEVIPGDPGSGHVACAGPALIAAKFWFDTFRADCSISASVNQHLSKDIEIFPIPFSDQLTIRNTTNAPIGIHQLQILDFQGRTLGSYELNPALSVQTIFLSDLRAGMYVLKWVGEKEVSYQKMLGGGK